MTASPRAAENDPALWSALRKVRWRLLPLLSMCYLVAYMDRANISFAAESMNHDLHFTPKIYGLGAGLFFLTYALCEIPSNALMLRFGARRWLARIMLSWGVIAALMAFVRTPLHFYGARLLLGCAEAGYFPGAVYYLSQWFPVRLRAQAISLFYVSLPISSVVMGAVAGTLLRLNGTLGLAGWQWMFLIEAAPAVVLSAVLWFTLPDAPATARWLQASERNALQVALTDDGLRHDHGGGLRAVLRNGRAWALGVAYLCELGMVYALTFSFPIVIKQLTGWDAARAGYLIAAISLLGAVAMLVGGWLSDRSGHRRTLTAAAFVLMALSLLAARLHFAGWIAVGGLALLMLSYYAVQPSMVSAMTTLMPGRAAATAVAFTNTFAICGGFVGPYWMGWMREATGGYAASIGWLALPCLLAAVLMPYVLQPKPAIAPALTDLLPAD
jgi:ACS family tartrate transporter-like MFS transporter